MDLMVRRDRLLVMLGLVAVAALAWLYMLYLARGMADMDVSGGMTAPRLRAWTAVDLALLFVMWTVMMVAMMVPSAASLILLFAAVNRQRQQRRDPLLPTGVFLLGISWCGPVSAHWPRCCSGGCIARPCCH